MIASSDNLRIADVPERPPTVWGLLPVQLHDRFWASRGVQVVRQGDSREILDGADLYLLTDARSLVLFGLEGVLADLSWSRSDLIFARLSGHRDSTYRERAIADQHGRFLTFRREYGDAEWRLIRVVLTRDVQLARSWQDFSDSRIAHKFLRRQVPRNRWLVRSLPGSAFDSTVAEETMAFLRRLMQVWRRPDTTIARATSIGPSVWADAKASVARGTRFVGPVWVGAGRELAGDTSVVGPSILWDAADETPDNRVLRWRDIEPTEPPRHGSTVSGRN